MNKTGQSIIITDPWEKLKKFTDARIGLGRCGTSVPLNECLDFKLAHARARDAVHQPMPVEQLATSLSEQGLKTLQLSSSVQDRAEYLTRPDKGKLLDQDSREKLKAHTAGYDICVALCDGLCSPAITTSAVPAAAGFIEYVQKTGLTYSPICLITNGRVAIGDEIGALLGAKLTVIFIGERPGLSSPNSMGAYITYNPRPGTTDEARNCISNIRPGGMSIPEAIQKTAYLVEEALRIRKTGIELKDKMEETYLPFSSLLNK